MKGKSFLNKLWGIAVIMLILNLQVTAQSPRPVSASYPSTINKNFVRTWNAAKPGLDPNSITTQVLRDAKQSTQYFDGLGRPLQTVIKEGSLVTATGVKKDMVSAIEYDAFGREQFKYSAFPSTTSDGLFKTDPFQQQATFMTAQYGPQTETFFYGQTVYENSPLNRVQETFAPGNSWSGTSWQASEANRRSVKMKYWANTSVDLVKIWRVTDNANAGKFGTYDTIGTYAPGELYKTITVDEHGKQVIEYKEKEDKLILKKVQLTAVADNGTGSNHTGWLCTYYIYDDLNNLRCVIQPAGVEVVKSNWLLTNTTILAEQCFRYEYDKRQRMRMKQVPGAGTVHMVYDARDRMVMTQDSVMRFAHQWLYTQYDTLNRPIATGLMTDNTNYNNAAYHRSLAEISAPYPAPGSYIIDTLTKTFYDDYAWRSGQGNPLSAARITTYDSYLQAPSNSTWPYPQDATLVSSRLKGMVTGTKVKVLGTPATYLYSVSLYDEKARPVQVQSQNVTTGTDIATTQYSWAGQPLLSIIKNDKAGANAQTSIALTQITYDDLGRVTKTEKKISNTKVNSGSMPATWKTIAQTEYDALGQIKKKNLSATPLESLTYEYNIRGWILGANRSYVKDTTSTANWFGFDLGYDKTTFTVNGSSKSYTAAQYNGNIGGMLWKSTGDDQLRKYDFSYDAVNRLTAANFGQFTSNAFSKSAGIDFSVSGISYDRNGNILNMNQKGWQIGGSGTIDSLLYTYTANTNKLLNVLDRKNDTATKLGDFRSSKAYMTALSNNKTAAATDYSYDANGNMYVDKNKDIGNIHYNYLNLPDSITVTGKGNIKYVYDATGNKLKKITTEGAKVTTTLYMFGNFINDTLQFLPQEEGRVRFKQVDNSLQYDYFIKDHLGNVRMVLTEEKDTSAYPVASLETTPLANEKIYYSGLDTGRVNKNIISGYPSDTYTNPNDFIQKLGTNGSKVGAGIVLKVMAGDKFNVRVNSWWNSITTPGPPVSPLSSLLSALNIGIGSVAGTKASSTELNSTGTLSLPITDFITSHSGYITSKPKAFVNWVLFDEQFKFVNNSSGFEQVNSSNVFLPHIRNDLPINKSGYLYVYVSNETPNIDVFFDNLQVTHIRGPLTEETHYYPFGLTMAGISSKAAGAIQNKEKTFQGQRFDDDLGLNWIQFKWRNHDPQIGRFIEIDPLSDKYVYNSPYAFSENKVTGHIELEGLESISIVDSKKEENKPIIAAADRNKDKNAIHIYAHGNNTSLFNDKGKTIADQQINSGKRLDKVLGDMLPGWKNTKEHAGTTVVLHSCRTGNTTTDKKGTQIESVAQRISASKEFKDVTIIAPTERDAFTDNEELGPRKVNFTDSNSDYKPGLAREKQGQTTEERGEWNVFLNGKTVGSYDGDWTPKANPGFIDELIHKN
ncbi:MAG: DUF6443 domain-containing protein [Ginsengibacter sp.]